MKRARTALLWLLLGAVVVALALRHRDDGVEHPVARRQFLAMGTQITITLAAPESANSAAALDDAQQRISAFAQIWAPWGDGALATINQQLRANQTAPIPDDMLPLWTRALSLRARSDGAFEPRIGALVRLWGFDDVARLRSEPPAPAAVRAALSDISAAPLSLGPCAGPVDRRCYGPAPGVQWDFGAIAKGWIVDQTLAELRKAGFDNALVDAGGNLAVRGQHGTRPWRIGIRNPRGDGSAEHPRLLATVDAHDEAVNTHGDYERYFEFAGQRYCHILDARSGMPVQGLQAVTVLHPDAAYADAAGLAVFVAGPLGWREAAARLGLEQVLVVTADGHIIATPALMGRLHAEPGIRIEPMDAPP